ncbi:MAG: phosphate/phosphite/phosphonate ABC transporter substrate-binding protein [Chloroflexi bacterium]|nr:phosphate/phosphite/phosphonate ABC transporter substrate-binding protein [Chloroflexota bacterium]
MRALGAVLAVAIAAAIAVVVLYTPVLNDNSPAADGRISLSALSSHQDNPTYEPNHAVLKFAVAAVLSPRATLENYESLASYLGKRLGRPIEIVQGKSYAETNALVRSGEATFALVCSGAFVVGRRDFGMQPLVVPVVNGATTYQSYLIVPTSSTVRTWEDLRHKTFAFTDPLSNSGRLVPVYVLSQMGEASEKFFKDFIFTYAHDRSIRAVAEGWVDGAAVDSLVYDYMVRTDPLIVAKTKVVWRSPPYGINPIIVHPNIDTTLRRDLASAFLGMRSDPEGQKVLARLGIDSFASPDPGAYDDIERMIRATAAR